MEKLKYILAIDQGTTGTKVIIFDQNGIIMESEYQEHQQYYPQSGYVEHDAEEIYDITVQLTKTAISKFSKNFDVDAIKSIGISNQGETCMVWDKTTGKPIYNAIVWQCRRTAEMVDKYEKMEGVPEMIEKKTGLLIDPYFSSTKFKWIIDNVPNAKEKLANNELMAGTLDTYLIWRMTGGKSYYTDYSTAARTMLFNVTTLDWDDEILDLFELPKSLFATPMPTAADFGVTDPDSFANLSIPINGSMVDQPASLFGHGCFDEGMLKNTYGTGCFLYLNTGNKFKLPGNGILSTIAWHIDGKTTYAFDGGVFIAGAAIQWLRDSMKIINNYEETDAIAKGLDDNGDVYFVPTFAGLAAPYWDQYARGTICGLTGNTTKEHIIRATLESVVYQVNDIVQIMNKVADQPIQKLSVDGGITKSDFTMQFQSDICGIELSLAGNSETTALGVAFMAGLHSKIWNDYDDLKKIISVGKSYKPKMEKTEVDKYLYKWKKAVNRSKSWANNEEEVN